MASTLMWVVTALAMVCVACATPNSEALLLPTALTCHDCPTVTITRTIDGDTLDTLSGPLRLYGWTHQKGGRGAPKRRLPGSQGLPGALYGLKGLGHQSEP